MQPRLIYISEKRSDGVGMVVLEHPDYFEVREIKPGGKFNVCEKMSKLWYDKRQAIKRAQEFLRYGDMLSTMDAYFQHNNGGI